ncbi:MAG TPA: hypothetical protein VJC39_02685 [Candidatus Nanoarchaeia archaeon]|nr:hypothetical protein [Candidatus Nanoarchaeia archaeon]
MVSSSELRARIKDFFTFSKPEIGGLALAIVVTAFIFSFRDWGSGDYFDLALGLRNLLVMILITGITFLFRLSLQKTYALREGYKSEFKVWLAGLVIALVVAFMSLGIIPLVLVGGLTSALMIRQRLGEFRYGFSLGDGAVISIWGICANIVLAILFAIGAYISPESYFFSKGLMLNLIMAFCSLLPFPQLDGLNLFFGSRNLYYTSIVMTVLAAILLLTKTKIGLIISVVVTLVVALVLILITSEK